jgi:hypothetical protein
MNVDKVSIQSKCDIEDVRLALQNFIRVSSDAKRNGGWVEIRSTWPLILGFLWCICRLLWKGAVVELVRPQGKELPVESNDATHGAIREGEPPYRRGHNPSRHPAMLVLVWSLRVVAVLLAGWAANWTYFAMWFRMEGSSELEMIKVVDVELGGAFALAGGALLCSWSPEETHPMPLDSRHRCTDLVLCEQLPNLIP